KLNEMNYDDWKIQMEAHLVEKDLFSIIDGTQEMPTTTPNSKAMRTYLQKQLLGDSELYSQLDECYRLEQSDRVKSEDSPISSVPSRITDLDKVMVLTSGLPPAYNSLLVHISTIPITSLNFEAIVTQLLNEEQRQ
ncbi:hypothetical protein BU17DRAFT_19082, partial [Hysterangium stoloniferum]